MDSPDSIADEEDDLFQDAHDDFPFYDCVAPDDSAPSVSPSAASCLESGSNTSPAISSGLRRRSSAGISRRGEGNEESGPPAVRSRERRLRFRHHSKEGKGPIEKMNSMEPFSPSGAPVDDESDFSTLTTSNHDVGACNSADSVAGRTEAAARAKEEKNDKSTVGTVGDERVGDSIDSASEPVEPTSSSLLISVAGFVLKAIGFQLNLIVNLVTLPFWCFYTFLSFVTNPYATIRRGRVYLSGKLLSLCNPIRESLSPFVYEWFKEHKSVWKIALRCGWGLFWSMYVCFLLFGLLVFATLASGFMMRSLVEEPLRMEEKLIFDYTKDSPVSYVPITSCVGLECGRECKEVIDPGKTRNLHRIPPYHKVQATVSLTLPESGYNRNLGVFQVRVDLLSASGKVLSSSGRPCLLQFKSEPIRLLLTFFKIAPLIAGFVAESQTMDVKFRGFIEGDVPTACVKVLIEPRAEFHPGAGIPEIYDASLTLESELPLFKRVVWYWKRTIFIWLTMGIFTLELLFALVCCRPIIFPRIRWGDRSARSDVENASSRRDRRDSAFTSRH